MSKKVKILSILNIISYLFMSIISMLIFSGKFEGLDSKYKFIIGICPYILVICTSFVLAVDRFVDFRIVKIEAIIDWGLRILAFTITINYSKKFSSMFLLLAFIAGAFLLNCILENIMNKKLIKTKDMANDDDNDSISYEEKCNLRHMVKAVNSGMFLIIAFCMFSLSVSLNKNMEGTASIWYFPVILSIVICILFTMTSYNNYMGYYLDKVYGKSIYSRDVTFALIGYIICLISSFIKMSYDIYTYIFIVALILLLPMISTIRSMSLRVRKIKNSLDKNSFRRFMMMKE